MPNVTTNSCEGCKHCFERDGQPQWECHRYPPVVHLIPQPPRIQGQQMGLVKQSMFPNCAERCGEFSPEFS